MKKALTFISSTILVVALFSFISFPFVQTADAQSCPFSGGGNQTIIYFGDKEIRSDRELEDSRIVKNANIAAGTYRVELSGYDDHHNSGGQDQNDERYRLQLVKSGRLLAQSNPHSDIPNGQDWINENVGEVTISESANQVVAQQHTFQDFNSANSLTPICARLTKINTVPETDPLSVSCSANRALVDMGDDVTWTAVATGGDGNYEYSWVGENLTGRSGNRETVSYSSSGVKSVQVIVNSDGQTQTANCGSVIVNDEPIDPVRVSCSVNKNYADIDEAVRWTANASGGNGIYEFIWQGNSPLDGERGDDVTVRYRSAGSKLGEVLVRSDGTERLIYCDTVYIEEDYTERLDGICYAEDTRVDEGEDVTWIAEAWGGSGDYDYEWSGTGNDIDGEDGRRVRVDYDSPGWKRAEVEITDDDGNRITRSCGTVLVDEEYYPPLNLSGACFVSPTRVQVGETVTWQASTNQYFSDRDFRWSGSDDLDGLRGQIQRVAYDTPGLKSGSFRVRTDDDRDYSFTCNQVVEVVGGPLGTLSVSLGQIPYTGPGDWLRLLGIISLIGIFSTVAVYIVRHRIGRRKIVSAIEEFKKRNLEERW